MTIIQYFLLTCVLLLSFGTNGQDSTFVQENLPQYDSFRLLYPFLNLQKNRISGDTACLHRFFDKLERIRNGSREHAIVVHIGDSHVQPGTFSMPMRDWFQTEFGNAGYGIIFPYRLAKSNGPSGYKTQCDTPWVSGRNATVKRSLPTGIAGFTLWSPRQSASFTVEFTSASIVVDDTLHLTVFHETRDSSLFFSISNELSVHVYGVLDSSQTSFTTYLIDDRPQKIRLRAMKTSESQTSATFYGMSLESGAPGVIVHTIGVNGAMFASYLESEHFTDQLAKLNPDLLIFSLGTNEAFSTKAYASDSFRTGIDLLFQQIRQSGNTAAVILTTPPGIYKSYRKKRRTSYRPNPVADSVSEVLRQYSISHGMALWDWYTIMGGKDGMAKWKAKNLTDKRYIHFSTKGYGIQGVLLREAIKGSYGEYKSNVKDNIRQ